MSSSQPDNATFVSFDGILDGINKMARVETP